MKYFNTLIFLAVLAFHSQVKAQNCNGTIAVSVDSASVVERYTDYVEVILPVSVRLRQKLKNCTDSIIIESYDQNSFVLQGPSGSVIADITDENGASLPQISSDTTAWNLEPSGARTTTFYVHITGEQILSPGNYNGYLNFYAYDGDSLLQQKTSRIRYSSPSLVGVSVDTSLSTYINGSNGVYVIDFGELEQGKVVNWNFDVISNSTLNIEFSADNQALVHVSKPNEVIDYTVKFRDQQVSLDGSKISLETFVGVTSLSVEIEIGNVDYKLAGHYTDQMYVTITAN